MVIDFKKITMMIMTMNMEYIDRGIQKGDVSKLEIDI